MDRTNDLMVSRWSPILLAVGGLRTPAPWVLAAGLAATPLLALLSPLGTDKTNTSTPEAVAFLGALAGTVLAMARLNPERWPLSTLGKSNRLWTMQLFGCFLYTLLLSVPGLLISFSLGGEAISWSLPLLCWSKAAQLSSFGVLLLQLQFSPEIRSILVVLLAWALPTAMRPTGWFGAALHATFGSARPAVAVPAETWAAWGSQIAPIVVLLGAALTIAEFNKPR